ncbi:MAG: LLM class flavin-dependent oxidoreductase, partial [Pyrinomonadaceae bacterium]
GNRLSLNVVSSWWAGEARKFGVQFDEHDDRYARTAEWLEVVDRLWKEDHFSVSGNYYKIEDAVMQPKPINKPVIYAGGESEKAKDTIARLCDAYVMHGDEPAKVKLKIEDMEARREKLNLPPMQYGVAGYTIVRNSDTEVKKEVERITDVRHSAAGYGNYQDWLANTKLEQQVSLEDYSVSNRGLRSGLIGTPDKVAERVDEFEAVGVNLLLLQCSPQLEEMERFSEAVINKK